MVRIIHPNAGQTNARKQCPETKAMYRILASAPVGDLKQLIQKYPHHEKRLKQ
jgi:hypothetical protein